MYKDNPKTAAKIIVIPETWINDIEQNNQNATIYNLFGQRMSRMQRGINIVNGKKILY